MKKLSMCLRERPLKSKKKISPEVKKRRSNSRFKINATNELKTVTLPMEGESCPVGSKTDKNPLNTLHIDLPRTDFSPKFDNTDANSSKSKNITLPTTAVNESEIKSSHYSPEEIKKSESELNSPIKISSPSKTLITVLLSPKSKSQQLQPNLYQLAGRGSQLINMIRKKHERSSKDIASNLTKVFSNESSTDISERNKDSMRECFSDKNQSVAPKDLSELNILKRYYPNGNVRNDIFSSTKRKLLDSQSISTSTPKEIKNIDVKDRVNEFKIGKKSSLLKKTSLNENEKKTESDLDKVNNLQNRNLNRVPITNQDPETDTKSNDLEIVDLTIDQDCNTNTSKKNSFSQNKHVMSSPEFADSLERNSQFLNSTIDISPIKDVDNHLFNDSATKNQVINKEDAQQLSPPNRKIINVTISPSVKRKQSVCQLKGRGAQMLSLVRNKQTESTPKQVTANLIEFLANDKIKISSGIIAGQKDISEQKSPVRRELLTFSKTLPLPHASPSTSILKRKQNRDEEKILDTPPSLKKKRVSFHNPPVSVTKEYLKDSYDESSKSYRQGKLPFKRKNKIESMNEISEIVESGGQKKNENSISMGVQKRLEKEVESQDDETVLTSSPSLYFEDDNAIFSYILDKYGVEDVLQKYADSNLNKKSIQSLMKRVKHTMDSDEEVKKTVLEILSENYPNEFLHYAIQENLNVTVFNKLNMESMIEFICEKCKFEPKIRTTLFEKVQNILSVKDFPQKEYHHFLIYLLKHHRLSNEQIIESIKTITANYCPQEN